MKMLPNPASCLRPSNISRRGFAAGSLALLWSLMLSAGWNVPARASDFAFGADLSFLKQAEDRGSIFKDGTNALPGLQIFKNHGYNWIRLRIFVEPVSNNLPNDLAYTLAEARDAKKLGYKFLLDFHYANSWADPAQQPTPGHVAGFVAPAAREKSVCLLARHHRRVPRRRRFAGHGAGGK